MWIYISILPDERPPARLLLPLWAAPSGRARMLRRIDLVPSHSVKRAVWLLHESSNRCPGISRKLNCRPMSAAQCLPPKLGGNSSWVADIGRQTFWAAYIHWAESFLMVENVGGKPNRPPGIARCGAIYSLPYSLTYSLSPQHLDVSFGCELGFHFQSSPTVLRSDDGRATMDRWYANLPTKYTAVSFTSVRVVNSDGVTRQVSGIIRKIVCLKEAVAFRHFIVLVH